MNYRRLQPASVFLLLAAVTVPATEVANPTLMDFDQVGTEIRWKTVNDNVMGGKSKGGFAVDEERGQLVFSGSTNTDGGGFSSIRTRRYNWQLDKDVSGIEVRVRAPNTRTYQLELRRDKGSRWVAYRANLPLDPEESDWQTVRVPFSELKTTVMGREVDAPALTAPEVAAIGFMIYNQRDGPFRLEVDRIAPFRDQPAAQPGGGAAP